MDDIYLIIVAIIIIIFAYNPDIIKINPESEEITSVLKSEFDKITSVLKSESDKITSFDNYVDTYVINLKNRPDKKKYMTNQLNEHKIKFNIFEGVDGTALNLNNLTNDQIIDQNKTNNIMGRYLRRGEFGCALSHIFVWNKLLSSDKKYFLVLEDDAILIDNFKNKLITLLNDINDVNWDILYLNENCYKWFNDKCNGVSYTDLTIKPTRIGYGLYGYIINKQFIKKCFDEMHNKDLPLFPIFVPIDTFIDHKGYTNKLVCLRSKEIMVHYDKKFMSDTQGII